MNWKESEIPNWQTVDPLPMADDRVESVGLAAAELNRIQTHERSRNLHNLIPPSYRCKFLAQPAIPAQSHGVRGSPLIRFIVLTVALAATALGLFRVTAARTSDGAPRPSGLETAPVIAKSSIPFHLLLSAPAAAITIDTGKTIRPSPDGSTISGTLELDSPNPYVKLIIKWKQAALPGEHRFARLTLDRPGQQTFTHVFDASGDIDDFLELPISDDIK
jgi:hypothetical protein